MAAATRVTAGIFVLTLGMVGAAAARQPPDRRDSPVLELRVFSYGAADSTDVRLAQQMVATLLSASRIQLAWRDCGSADRCDDSVSDRFFIRVLLLPTKRASDPSISGDALHSAQAPTALVYLPRVEEMVKEIRQTPTRRSHMALMTLMRGHVIGLTIAHEVGHLLGLPHSSRGLMTPKLNVEDVIASRLGALGLHRKEAQTLRRELLSRDSVRLAREEPRR